MSRPNGLLRTHYCDVTRYHADDVWVPYVIGFSKEINDIHEVIYLMKT